MHDPIATTANEFGLASAWWDTHLAGDIWPFSFQLDGKRIDCPSGWTIERSRQDLEPQREQMTIIARHPDHGLVLRCVAVRYRDFPALEWTLHLDQSPAGRCPMISDLLGLDATWQHGQGTDFVLRSHIGDDHHWRNIYEPQILDLWPRVHTSFAPTSASGNEQEGRPSSGAFPYFAVEEAGFASFAGRPLREGFLLAIGWPGRWTADFVRDQKAGLRIRAGQERTRFRLKPGESCRAPLITLLLHGGEDRRRVANLWRRWMLAHNLPRIRGELPAPMLEASTCGFLNEMTRADQANQIEYIDRHRDAGLAITHWWMDAGWYPCYNPHSQKNFWHMTGTWEPDRSRFPHGLRAINDHLHQRGIRSIVWFEPERVTGSTWLRDQRPQWLLTRQDRREYPPGDASAAAIEENHLLDLGHPEARAWLIDRVASLITSEGIDVYRQDFNFNPLPYWRDHDAPGREGMTEQGHVCGYLAFGDALRQRFPDLLLDSCASGGRRNDLESMRRSVTLHPTDHRYDDLPVKQAMRHTLFQWIPFFGGPVLPLDRVDAYAFRSTLGLSTVFGFDLRQPHDLDLLRRLTVEWQEVAHLFYGDFYPLTSYSLGEDAWMAWQFHRHAQDDGLIQVFRRPDSPMESACLPLHGLDPDARYVFHDYDLPDDCEHRGADLLSCWRIAIPERRTARLIRYRRV